MDAKVKTSPLLEDLVNQYNLPLNHLGRLSISNDFELREMRSPLTPVNQGKTSNALLSKGSWGDRGGRMYAAGAITLGGPYAPVDSFLGLQYAALRSIESLAAARAPGMQSLGAVRSLTQWWKWALNQSPG